MMTVMTIGLLSVPALFLTLVALLTGVGQYRRSHNLPLSIAAAVLFPAFWIAWYVRDDLGVGRA
ncbi:hypothetical protein [Rhodococcus sp. H29-C3]|uniref:hypothetical protein n=1 Tax=Rhodococcus sp. H29-C3 TaxID=3046307 RepID=UPI0024BA939B|nr:hypothetical protein [Rhodococcus sp. H29-C3]MDJ0363366.1 hypothetical protein [Rhodococcus sp. H29-C3]